VTGRPLRRWASTDVLAAVVEVEMAVFRGQVPTKHEALLALAARRELEERMRRHLWLSMETARKVGASWAEIAAATGMSTAQARQLFFERSGRHRTVGPGEANRTRSVGLEL
jgi:hypothetical protein